MSKINEAFELLNDHFNSTDRILSSKTLSEEMNISIRHARRILSKWKNSDKKEKGSSQADKNIKHDYKDDSGSVNIKSLTIKTLDDAIREANIDLDVWNVDRYVVNTWQTPMKVTKKKLKSFNKDKVEYHIDGDVERPFKLKDSKTDSSYDEVPVNVTNYQVKVWLKRKTPDRYEEAIKELIGTLPSIDKISKIKCLDPAPDGDVAAELALYDAHFGKFAWHKETLMGNWDISICTDAYLGGAEKGLNYVAPFNPSKIFFVLGQDFMHVDNSFFTTPHGGNQLDADGRFPKIARKAMETIIAAINMCKQVAPIEVKWVPGNHDLHASFWLSLILEQVFKNDPYVNVDNTPAQRKAVLWGELLVGWWHDASGRKLNASMNALAQFWPELWGKSKFRELHIGHKHKKVQTKMSPIETTGGVLVRQIPSLSSIDYWHQEMLFVDAIPASETLLWSKENGVFGNFTINTKPNIK